MPVLVESDYGPLLVAADLADYPGAPFAESVVLSAGESVRDEAGWHIAPSVTETLTVVSKGGTALLIPSLVYSVSAIRDIGDPANPVAVTDYVDRGSGILHRDCGWVTGRKYEVDLTHGYSACPPALVPVVAHRAQAAKVGGSNVRLGSLSVGADSGSPEQDDAILARYRLR